MRVKYIGTDNNLMIDGRGLKNGEVIYGPLAEELVLRGDFIELGDEPEIETEGNEPEKDEVP